MGNTKKAEELYRRSLNSFPVPISMIGLGSILTGKGKTDEADTLLRSGLKILIQKFPEDHPYISEANTFIGGNLIAQKKYDEAEKFLLAAYKNLLNKRGKNDSLTRAALNQLIKSYELLGKFDKANELKL